MSDIGVPNPSAHGQAMIITDTALSTANFHAGSVPISPQTKNVAVAAASTARTNQYATLSAMRCIGARERCACATNCTICDSTVSEPTLPARITSAPVVL